MPDSPPGVGHTDSIDSHDSNDKQPEKKKSRRPANTAFRQQRLKAWQPILTPKTVLPLFFGIGIIFAPIGGLLLWASSEVQELRIDYTDCTAEAETSFSPIGSDRISTAFKGSDNDVRGEWRLYENVTVQPDPDRGIAYQTDICELQFRIPEDMGAPVLFYYHLTNFYQNHRRYVDSFFASQLRGNAESRSAVRGSNCDPLDYDDELEKPYYPCGLIANSMFNDTFTSPMLTNEGNELTIYPMSNDTDIAWASDRDLYGDTEYEPGDVVPPPNWRKVFPNYTTDNPPPRLREWEAFHVWMRTAGLPEFSKLYQRNNTEAMRTGIYRVNITDNFPTKDYRGTKSIIISTRTVMGGRNNFLGIAYVVVGGVCMLLGAIFTVTHLIKPRKLGDHTYLSWNNVPGGRAGQPGAAAAPGSSSGGGVMASGREVRPGDA